ncbi:MAG TPA: RNA methyltransferase [Caulobacteraceae bacterium]
MTIAAVGAHGDGFGEGLFVPGTLPGERVRVEARGEQAALVAVLDRSTERVEPPCPYVSVCGGCALQHWAPEPYLAWKLEQLRHALARERLETDILPPVTVGAGQRRRVAMHVRRQGKDVVLGFKGRRSWAVADVDACLLAEPAINAALPGLRFLAGALFEHPASAPTLHVTNTLTGLDVEISGVERRSGGLSAQARVRLAEAAAAADLARLSLAGETLYLARSPVVRMGPALVDLPPGAFLQAAEVAETAMAAFAVEAAAGATRIADLHCGLGAFTFPLAAIAPVRAADVSEPAIRALGSAVASAPGLKAIAPEVRDLDRRPMLSTELDDIDVVVFDPPRAGAVAQVRQIAASACPKAIALSCNPATFARDARLLVDGGFVLKRLLPVDQFLWSAHIELAAEFVRT